VAFKWHTYGRRNFRRNLIVFWFTWICYEIGVSIMLHNLLHVEDLQATRHSTIAALCLVAFAALLAFIQLGGEFTQLRRKGVVHYLMADKWNWCDLAFSLTIPAECVVLGLCSADGANIYVLDATSVKTYTPLMRAAQIMSAAGTFLFLLRFPKAVRGLEKTSALITLLLESVADMLPFLTLLFSICLAFAIILWHLGSVESSVTAVAHEDALTSTAVLDALSFGLGDSSAFHYPTESWLLIIVFLVMNIFLIVVMLNSLIAILGHLRPSDGDPAAEWDACTRAARLRDRATDARPRDAQSQELPTLRPCAAPKGGGIGAGRLGAALERAHGGVQESD